MFAPQCAWPLWDSITSSKGRCRPSTFPLVAVEGLVRPLHRRGGRSLAAGPTSPSVHIAHRLIQNRDVGHEIIEDNLVGFMKRNERRDPQGAGDEGPCGGVTDDPEDDSCPQDSRYAQQVSLDCRITYSVEGEPSDRPGKPSNGVAVHTCAH